MIMNFNKSEFQLISFGKRSFDAIVAITTGVAIVIHLKLTWGCPHISLFGMILPFCLFPFKTIIIIIFIPFNVRPFDGLSTIAIATEFADAAAAAAADWLSSFYLKFLIFAPKNIFQLQLIIYHY